MRINFKDSATAVMEGIVDFHNDIQVYLMLIVIFVAWMLFSIIYEFGIKMTIKESNHNTNNIIVENLINLITQKREDERVHLIKHRKYSLITKSVTHGVILEIIWTILPVFVLIAIAVPSFALLYSIDEIIDPTLTIKVIGHQWYWSYEYTDYTNNKVGFDSYMIAENDLQLGDLRLLEVDRKVWLPINTHIRVLITANDVLHAWAIPSFGIKMDAVPGRLNQVSLYIKREGIFYGQCSELCGVNHGFMPIVVKAVPLNLFNIWINFLFNKGDGLDAELPITQIINNKSKNIMLSADEVTTKFTALSKLCRFICKIYATQSFHLGNFPPLEIKGGKLKNFVFTPDYGVIDLLKKKIK